MRKRLVGMTAKASGPAVPDFIGICAYLNPVTLAVSPGHDLRTMVQPRVATNPEAGSVVLRTCRTILVAPLHSCKL